MVDKKKSGLRLLCQVVLCYLFLCACNSGKDINSHESRRIELTNYHAINITSSYKDPFNIDDFTKISVNANIISKPVIHNENMYVIDKKGVLYSINIDTQAINWHKTLILNKDNIGLAGVTYHKGLLHITTGQRELIILDAVTAQEKSRKVIADISYTPPIVMDNIVIVQTINSKLYAYDTSNHFALLWFYDTSLGEIMIQKDSSLYDYPRVIHNKDCLLLHHGPQKLAYIRIKDGKILWSTNLGNLDSNLFGAIELSVLATHPIFDDKYVYMASSDDKLLKIQLSTGNIEWEKQIFSVQSISHIDEDQLAVTTAGKQLLIIAKKSGNNSFVGELVDVESKKNKLEYMFMYPPLIGKNGDNLSLNVIATKNHNSYLFSFEENDNIVPNGHQFNTSPQMQKYMPYISYYDWDITNKTLLIVRNNNIYFKKLI